MGSRASTFSFGLFVVVLLATLFWLLHQSGKTNWGLVAVLLGVLLLRAALFALNLRQQRRNVERGKGPVRIETRLGLDEDGAAAGSSEATSATASDAGPNAPPESKRG